MGHMRLIAASCGQPDVTAPTAAAILAAVERGTQLRESFDRNGTPEKAYWYRVIAYQRSEGGRIRYAVLCDALSDVEVYDTDDQAEADRFYETSVREKIAFNGWKFRFVDFPLDKEQSQ